MLNFHLFSAIELPIVKSFLFCCILFFHQNVVFSTWSDELKIKDRLYQKLLLYKLYAIPKLCYFVGSFTKLKSE